jgi:hypothetical protein
VVRNVHGRLDGEGDAVQWAKRIAALDSRFSASRLLEDEFGVVIDKGVQRRIKAADAIEVGASDFDWRNFFVTYLSCDL